MVLFFDIIYLREVRNIRVSLTPRSDTIFKAIFGDQRNVNILARFLRAVFEQSPIKIEFSELKIADTNLIADNKDERNSAVDVLAITDKGEKIDIEIQINDHNDIQKRTVFYASRMTTNQVTKQVKLEERYRNIKTVIVIAILDFKIRRDDDKYFHGNILKDMIDNKIYTDVEQIYTLELPKIPANDDNKELWTWLKFLKSNNAEEIKELRNKIPEVDQAMSIYENFISNEELKSILETREIKYKLERNEWYAEGKEEGHAEGLAEGETNAKIELAVKLIKTGKMSLEEAIIFCGLDKSQEGEIKKLLNQ